MPSTVLITGGTGLVGTRLTALLLERGYAVAHLSRQPPGSSADARVQTYAWDPAAGTLDEEALRQTDYLVHLAGAGIADQRWTPERKVEIVHSRTESIGLLISHLATMTHRLRGFVSASAVGYYGADTGGARLTEESPPGDDFLAGVTTRWEAAADRVAQLGIRTVKLRIGIVLSDHGGALPKLTQPIRLGAGAALGSGEQFMSWIHLDDLARLFLYALENETLRGAYNAVAPNPVTNAQLTRLAADALGKPLWLPNVPRFALQLAFGEMAAVVLGGNYVLNQRLATETDFAYHFTDARAALADLLP